MVLSASAMHPALDEDSPNVRGMASSRKELLGVFNRAIFVLLDSVDADMKSNLKALIERSTPLSVERAGALIAVDLAANSHRYPQPLSSSEAMESEHVLNEGLDGPPVPETVISIAVKSALLIEEERRRMMMLSDAMDGLNDTRNRKVLSEEEFRKLPWRSDPVARCR